MKYIIMCGGAYPEWKIPRQLYKVGNETIVGRTIRLLQEAGVDDICISATDSRFDQCGVPVIHHQNNYGKGGLWLDAFCTAQEPTCYIFGDVFFSKKAIETIVNTDTDDVQFFASAPPFDKQYIKKWAEPFAFKATDYTHFNLSVMTAKNLVLAGRLKRGIAWQLWQVIKQTPLNQIDYTNYKVINDFTCDVDEEQDVSRIIARVDQWLST